MIVKLQVAIAGTPMALAYSKGRAFAAEYPVDKATRQVMKGRAKAYFEADIVGDKLNIIREVEEQDW